MKRNGSPSPIFETDKEKAYFLTTLLIHPEFNHEQRGKAQVRHKSGTSQAQVEAQVKLSATERKILMFCSNNKKSSRDISDKLGYKKVAGNLKRALPRLMKLELLALTIPDKPRSSQQQYYTTEKGKQYLSK